LKARGAKRGAKIVFEKIKYVKLMRRAFIKLSGS
jgi:hypothetical protein